MNHGCNAGALTLCAFYTKCILGLADRHAHASNPLFACSVVKWRQNIPCTYLRTTVIQTLFKIQQMAHDISSVIGDDSGITLSFDHQLSCAIIDYHQLSFNLNMLKIFHDYCLW